MWFLPPLSWMNARWRLPLSGGAASELVLTLLAEPTERPLRLSRFLLKTPEVVVWSVCRATVWRDRPPASVEHVAEWFQGELLEGTWQWDAVESPDGNVAPDCERGSPAPSLPSGVGWILDVLGPTWPALARHWTASGPNECPSVEDAPWFPLWLRTGLERLGSSRSIANEPTLNAAPAGDNSEGGPPRESMDEVPARDAMSEDEAAEAAFDLANEAVDGELKETVVGGERDAGNGVAWELARMLPAVLARLRRIERIERDFAAALETEKLAAMRELAYGASHEINNPLANIATRAQALMRDEPDWERRQKLATIAAQAFRAFEMIADMMLFAKPPMPQRETTRIDDLVAAVLKEVEPDATAQGTSVRWSGAPSLPTIHADPAQLGAAIKGLVRNSLEALVAGGVVEIRAEGESDRDGCGACVAIYVRDSGPGISPEVRKHLFDPFYSGREAGRGLGFGLSKVWRIAEMHGGSIEVESEPGFGATFVLRIPVKQEGP